MVSAIDKLQKGNDKHVPKRTGWQNLKEVFGEDKFSITWLFPSDVEKDLVLEH